MTPQEKALELVDKFKPYSHFWVNDFGTQKEYELERLENAKECALIAVDEIIDALLHHSWQNKNEISFYEEVKQEIEKL